MYQVYVLATHGDPAPSLIRTLEEEGISYAVVRDIQDLGVSPPDRGADAVVVDGSACDLQDLPRAVQQCRELGLPLLCGLSAAQLESYDVSWGANDFFLSPPLVGEVTARIKQLVWKEHGGSGERLLRAGDMVIDLDRYEVSCRGRRVVLTFKEYQLLCLLAANPGRVYSREALLSEIWGYDYFGGTRTVDVHIRRLRSKIEDAGPAYIETVWNVGYRFRPLGTDAVEA